MRIMEQEAVDAIKNRQTDYRSSIIKSVLNYISSVAFARC